ncbi:MAG: hypothetical protein EBR40_00175 [Proteobacteria bacterium]|nr:hypothetical protein [Pseudomonadota bacterium]
MKKLFPQPLPRLKALLIMAGLATALVSETYAQTATPTPTPKPTPVQRTRKTPPPPPVITPYSG